MFVLEPGSVVAGRYRLEQQLGEGGMGVVWSATHAVTKRRVALKFLKDRVAGADVRRRFVREARAACAVSHDGILPVHDVIESDDGEPALVMDLLRGEPLAQRLAREGKLSVVETATILLPVFAALGAAHAAGVVHRDIKPDNIFLSEGGVRILDFGLAKATLIDAGTARSVGAQSGEVVGTPRYMSPEQAFGEKDVDHRSDIWALGLVAYECLSGVLPTGFDSLGQILKTILSGSITPLHDLEPALPQELCNLVDRMLRRERGQRPDGLNEVADVFARAAGLAAKTIPPPKQRGAAAVAAAAASAASEAPATSDREPTQDSFESDSGARPRASARNRLFVAAAAAALVVAALLLLRQPAAVTNPPAPASAPAATLEVTASASLAPQSAAAPPSSSPRVLVAAPATSASASASASAQAHPRKRRLAGSATPYDDPPELDF